MKSVAEWLAARPLNAVIGLAALQSLQREHGDMVSMRRPNGRLAYFVNDAFEVRRLLTRRHAKYVKGPGFERVKMLRAEGEQLHKSGNHADSGWSRPEYAF